VKPARNPSSPERSEIAGLRARVVELERERLWRLEAEQALRESQARYRELIDQCPDPIVVHRDGLLLFANQAAAGKAGSGLAPADLVGRQVLDFVHPSERGSVRAKIRAVSEGAPPPETQETRVFDTEGRELFVESVERWILWEGVPAIQVVVRDVSERRRAEEALRRMHLELEQRVEERTRDLSRALEDLRRSEQRHRALVEASPDTLIRVRVDGTLLDMQARPGFQEQFAPRGRVGRSVLERFTPAQGRGLLELFARVCRSGEMERIEHRSENEKGVRYFESRIVASGADEVLLITRDITRARLAMDALRDSEERFRRIFEEGPLGMALIGSDLRFVKVNPTLCRALGFSEEELARHTFLDLTHPDDVAGDLEMLRRLQARELATFTVEKRYLHRDGRALPFRVTGALVRDVAGEPSYGIGMFEDISEEKRAEAALREAEQRLYHSERLASIGTLAAGIAHEINNPIGSILLAAQYALSVGTAGDEVARRSLEDIAGHARRCGGIVKNVLRFARQETLERRPCDLNECVERIRDLARQVAEGRSASVEFDLCEKPLPVLVNPTAIEQVLLNVIRNAVEADEAGGRVSVVSEAGPGSARVVVRDEGRGMSVEEKTYLFDPFYTTRRVEGGTGLGLSISHGIVTDHGGAIHVDSQPGRGTTITVELPSGAA